MEHRAEMSTVANQEYYGLPDGYIQMRHFALKTNPSVDLNYMTPERFEDRDIKKSQECLIVKKEILNGEELQTHNKRPRV